MNNSTVLKSLLICMAVLGSMLFPLEASAARPSAPSNLRAFVGDATSITLTWQDNSNNEEGFRIYRETEVEGVYAEIAEIAANRTNYGSINLKPGTEYSYRVKAFNDDGESFISNTVSATTQEAVVKVTSPNGGEEWKSMEKHNITWTSNGEGFQAQLRYRIGSSAWIDIAIVPNTNSYSWTIPNADSSQVRVVVRLLLDGDVVCVDQSDANFTIKLSGMTLGPTFRFNVPPSNLHLSYLKPNVILSWTDNSSNETGFKIERKEGTGAYVQIGATAANITTYSDPFPENKSTYRVCAYYSTGDPLCSNDARSVHYVLPSTPHDLTANPASPTTIMLNWDYRNAGFGDGVEIERRTGSSAFARIGDIRITADHITDHSLQVNTSYTYRVRTYTEMLGGGRTYSEFSNEATARTLQTGSIPPEEDSTAAGRTVLRFTIESTEYFVKTSSDSTSRLQTMDTAPIISEGRTLLPIRYVSEPLGADVGWDAALDQVTVQLGGKNIVMWINNGTARINGAETAIDPANPGVTPIIVPPGRTMLPLRFIAENLGCAVDWNADIREVTVTYPKTF